MSGIKPAERHVDLGDAVIEYLDYESEGPPLILLHATGFMPWLWHPVAAELAGSFRVIAPYFCNYRNADPENGGLSWKQIAADLINFCEKLDLKKPYAAGHSMGGAVFVIAAGALGLEVEKMVLIEPIILPEEFYAVSIKVEDHPMASKSIKRRNYWRDRNEASKYLESKQLFKNWDKQVLDLYIDYGMAEADDGGLCLACHPKQEASLFMGSTDFNPWPVIQYVACPVLVLEGEHTENKDFIDFKKQAEMFPNCSHRVVEGAGHLVPMEKPKDTAVIMRKFFEE
ncbi:MAG: alpha/beta fold hydrolase [Desulfobacterales bacterium]